MAVNVLLSYAFHGPQINDTDLAAVRRELVCGRLMVDSGAFTAHSTGKPVKLSEYAAWLERWRGCWDHAVTLDKIGDPVASARQTRRLHEMGLPVMPVFTKGAALAEFDAMVRDVGYVCVGGMVGKGMAKMVRARVAMLQRRAADMGGGIHALGVTAMDTLRYARPYSADASNVSAAFLFGNVIYFDGRQMRNPQASNRERLIRDREHITGQGIELAAVMRAGRLPNGKVRDELMVRYSLGYACADETLKRSGLVPGPSGAPPGTHIYNSITPKWGVMPAASLDRMLHDPTSPLARTRAWQRYGARHHVCTAERLAEAAQ